MYSNPNPNPNSSTTATQQNGAHPNTTQNSAQAPSQSQQLNAPPGVSGQYTQLQQQETSGLSSHPPGAIANAYASNGEAANPNSNPNPNPSHHSHTTHPQTPAQQILMSAADRWGLLGLLQMIKNAGTDADHGLSSIGTDLGTMGLDMGYSG
jgi:CCR4-NOT transcription complex subunit 2